MGMVGVRVVEMDGVGLKLGVVDRLGLTVRLGLLERVRVGLPLLVGEGQDVAERHRVGVWERLWVGLPDLDWVTVEEPDLVGLTLGDMDTVEAGVPTMGG